MKIKATKTMANCLQKNIKLDCIDSIKLQKMSIDEFKRYVDYDAYAHEDNDYDYETSQFSIIQITYKPECYAMPKYLTTKDLLRCYKHSDGTLEGFIDEVWDEIEI